MCAVVSRRRIFVARMKALRGLGGLPEIVGLEISIEFRFYVPLDAK